MDKRKQTGSCTSWPGLHTFVIPSGPKSCPIINILFGFCHATGLEGTFYNFGCAFLIGRAILLDQFQRLHNFDVRYLKKSCIKPIPLF